MSRPGEPTPEHQWIETTQLCDRDETWECAHCDARQTRPRSQCQTTEETPR